MNIVKWGKHTAMSPSLVEYEIRDQDGSRCTWFWWDHSRESARTQAREKLEFLLNMLNHGKHKQNRLTAKSLNVYVDNVKMKNLGGG